MQDGTFIGFQIAELTVDDNLDMFARDVLDHCINLPPDMYEIEDACLCHGVAGAAHIYNRLYQAKGNSRYRDASVFSFEYALDMFRPGTEIGGYSKCARHYDFNCCDAGSKSGLSGWFNRSRR